MGIGIKCFFGFSIASNPFAEQLERHGAAMQRHQRQAAHDFDLALEALHDAVDAGLAGNSGSTAAAFQRGEALLSSCNDHLTASAGALVQARADLYDRAAVDPADPLVVREGRFPALDYEAISLELGAGAIARAWWDELVVRVRDGGGRGGLRLLERYYRELQSDLTAFAHKARGAATTPAKLHASTPEVAAVVVGFARLSATLMYLSALCEHASTPQPALAAAG